MPKKMRLPALVELCDKSDLTKQEELARRKRRYKTRTRWAKQNTGARMADSSGHQEVWVRERSQRRARKEPRKGFSWGIKMTQEPTNLKAATFLETTWTFFCSAASLV